MACIDCDNDGWVDILPASNRMRWGEVLCGLRRFDDAAAVMEQAPARGAAIALQK